MHAFFSEAHSLMVAFPQGRSVPQLPPRLPQTPTPTPPAPPAPPTTPVPLGADLGALQTQLSELQVQQSGLKAQWNGLKRQLDQMLQNNPARPGVQQEWANVGSQLASVDGQVAALSARIAQKQGGTPGTPSILVNPPIRRGDPDLPIAGGIAIMLALILPLSVSYAIRMLRRAPAPVGQRIDDLSPRFDRLEQAVDAIAIEVERVSEGQRFVTKILAERAPQAPADPNQALALGAGPVEPIRVQDRPGVRQSR